MDENLLDDIELWLQNSDMAATTFGRKAVNDGKLVSQLRKGRRLWPETAKKIRDFMSQPDTPTSD